jgi:hypothetical protein
MKIILSHDIDHLNWSEHLLRDTYIPKLILRTGLQRIKNLIDTKTALARIDCISKNRLHRLDELIRFLKNEQIRSTFFIGFGNGLNLSYTNKQALDIGQRLVNDGFAVGIHGIQYNSLEGIKSEKTKGTSLLSTQKFTGIRMHYLRYDPHTPQLLSASGYMYDSTEYKIADPYEVCAGLWSFPIGVMDCYAVTPEHESLELGKTYTLKLIKEAIHKKLNYFVVNFHDIYFDDNGYNNYKEWLIWLVQHLKNQGHTFTDFETAITDLQQSKTNQEQFKIS